MEPILQPVSSFSMVYPFYNLIFNYHNPQILHMEVPNTSLSGFLWWTIEMIDLN